jgi:hypothetical protein
MRTALPVLETITVTPDDRRAADLLQVAQELVTQIRDDDPRAVQRRIACLTDTDHRDVTILLAAMVPDDQPTSDLLAWFLTPAETR